MLMRTPLAPAAISCSTISGSRDAGPSVIKIFARLKSLALQSGYDGSFDILARSWSKADKTLYELALTIKHERLWNAVTIAHQKGYEIFVRLCECVLDAEFFCKLGDFLVVAWSTHVESDHDQSLVFVLLLHAD